MTSAAADLGRTFAALADPTRRRVVELLRKKPRRAGELAAAFGMSAPRHEPAPARAGAAPAWSRQDSLADDARVRVYRLRQSNSPPCAAGSTRWRRSGASNSTHSRRTRSAGRGGGEAGIRACHDPGGGRPGEAFEVFTREIDAWWKRGPRYRFASGALRFEGRVVKIDERRAPHSCWPRSHAGRPRSGCAARARAASVDVRADGAMGQPEALGNLFVGHPEAMSARTWDCRGVRRSRFTEASSRR